MGQVVKGPLRSPSAEEKLEREIVVLRELIPKTKPAFCDCRTPD